jgi:CRP/FNR family cyclic AMP-dependent transcriptional regulator
MINFSPSPNVLSGLSHSVLSTLFDQGDAVDVKAGDILFAAGDQAKGCYRLEDGLVKITVTSPKGEERILTVLARGAIIGELSLIDGLPRSGTVVALQKSAFRFIDSKTFSAFCLANPDVQQQLVRILATRLRESNDALAAATFLTLKGRVAHALLLAASQAGKLSETRGAVPARINQTVLADLAGVARENVSRVMSEWTKRNLIERSAGSLEIKDVAALRLEIEFIP